MSKLHWCTGPGGVYSCTCAINQDHTVAESNQHALVELLQDQGLLPEDADAAATAFLGSES